MTYEEVLSALRANADETYRAFHKKLLKNDRVNVIGVRMPVLRRLAKEWKAYTETFLRFPDEFYEVTFLKCALVGQLPYGEFVNYVDAVVPLLDNWATCDCFAPKCVASHREEFLSYLEKYASRKGEFERRFALTTLLHFYVTEEYFPVLFRFLEESDQSDYYVMMAAAWLTAEVIVTDFEAGVAFLRKGVLTKETHNKAIQKARESFRLSAEQKAFLSDLKRK